VIFSRRTNWHRGNNPLTEAVELRRKSGKPIYDLTISNPTECGFDYPEQDILRAISNHASFQYRPDLRGLLSARESIANLYHEKGARVDPSDIFLTASTSEAYSLIFKLLCDPGDSVVVPIPSYPLFDYLTRANDVTTQPYRLFYDHGWHIDLASLSGAISPRTKAIVLINPHNPTGMFLKKPELQQIKTIAQEKSLSLIVDEVFAEYAFEDDLNRVPTTADSQDCLTFTLDGISKMCGLPQMKLGWIVLSGERKVGQEATGRLEILSDMFLSVNAPAQNGLGRLLAAGSIVCSQILARVRTNYETLRSAISTGSPCSLLSSEGGWYGILLVPRTKPDEQWAMELLEEKGVYLYPGYFFDFEQEGCLIVSLLPDKNTFEPAVKILLAHLDKVA